MCYHFSHILMAKLIGDQMTNVIVHLVLPFQWGLGGACAEPATRLGTVSPLIGRTAPDQPVSILRICNIVPILCILYCICIKLSIC